MDDRDLLEKFVDFLNEFYKDELVKAANEEKKSFNVDFSLLEKFDVNIADYLLENPAETIKIIEKAVKQIDIGYLDENFRVRFFNLPENRNIRIRNVRAEHIGKMIVVDGFVKRASEVRPEVSEAIFQCLDCGSNITIIQTERMMHAPIECENPACKNRKTFKLVDQKLYDARWTVVEEPFELTSGERPSDLRIYLKEDLTTPKMQNKTEPGNRIKTVGILKELPRRIKGSPSRQMEIYLDANHVESVETEWEELEITPENEQKILELAKDPEIYTKLLNSIAPGIYGLEEVKEAITLQLFSGEVHIQKDRSRVRGDIHCLLVGDPSTAKSVLMKVVSGLIPRGRYVSGKGVSIDYDDPIIFMENGIIKTDLIGPVIDKFYNNQETGFVSVNNIKVPALNFLTGKINWFEVKDVYRHNINEPLIKTILETGREIRITSDHSVYSVENCRIVEKKASELKIGDYLLIPRIIPSTNNLKYLDLTRELKKIPKEDLGDIHVEEDKIKSKFSKFTIPSKIPVDDEFMRLIGYYIADGWLHETKGDSWKIEFELDSKDEKTIKDIENIVKKLFHLNVSKNYKRKTSCRVTINSKVVFILFKYILKVTKGAVAKKIPEIVFNSSRKNQLEFLKGFIIGDYGVTVSKNLFSDLLYLFLLNGIIATFSRRIIKKKITFPDGHSSIVNREIYELKSPKPHKILENVSNNSNLHCRIPIEFFSIPWIKGLKSSEYSKITEKSVATILSKNRKLIYDRLKIIKNGILSKELSRLTKRKVKSIQQYLNGLVKKGILEKYKGLYKPTSYGKKIVEEIDWLLKLQRYDVGFLKIKKIDRIKPTKKFVYDFSVPQHENFVGGFGGILCHNTGAGLTATVVKDEEFLGGWVLEAGALVMTNRSMCAIDEFEKIEKTDQVALHEMMEQQTISIAKANIVATLPAMTAILAGGNPKLGRFDPYLPIKEQIDIPETILSRFDLKFALRDIPNVETDTKIADHILQSRHFGGEESTPVIDNETFKKYVAYARKNCHPKLSREAGNEIKNFYLSLRERSGEESPISITPRQYEALIRMAEASAKIQLRDEVTKEDALRAINLMKASLRQFGFEPSTGQIDIDRAEGARATSAQRSRIRVVLDILDELEKTFGRDIPFDEIIKRARDQGVDTPDDILKKMQQEGMLYSSRPGFISKV